MKHSEIKIPNSALAFYVKLYCRKRRENKSELNDVVSEATKSWLTLSQCEKHHFTSKYQQIKKNIKKQFADQLKNAVPYLKKKVIPVPRAIAASHTENVIEEGNTILDGMDQNAAYSEIPYIEKNIADTNSFCVQNDNVIEEPILDQSNIILNDNYNIPISEPIPPKPLNGEQLFNMVTKTTNNPSWPALSTTEKRKYQNAVLSIKRNYLKEYKKYLDQLPPEKLYEHYTMNTSV